MKLRHIAIASVLALGVGTALPVLAQAASAPASAANAAKPAKRAAPQAAKFVIEQRAMDLLKATSARLAAAKSMSFTALVTEEYPSRYGPPVAYPVRYDVTMQRPDKLKVLQSGAGPTSEFYYDGKAMMAFAPAENLVAEAVAPPSVDAALKTAFDLAAIYYPFTDLLVADPFAALTDGTMLAFYVGPSGAVGGVNTEMVAWANRDVFLQIWIGADDKLPRRIRAIYSADPAQLRHDMELSNWQIDGAIPAQAFASEKAQAAKRMAFAKPVMPPRQGVKPLVRKQPAQPAAGASQAAQ